MRSSEAERLSVKQGVGISTFSASAFKWESRIVAITSDCKSLGRKTFGGSSPPSPTKNCAGKNKCFGDAPNRGRLYRLGWIRKETLGRANTSKVISQAVNQMGSIPVLPTK